MVTSMLRYANVFRYIEWKVFNFRGDAIVFGGVCVGVCMWGGGGGGGGGDKKGQISTADCVFTLGPHVMNFLNFPMY